MWGQQGSWGGNTWGQKAKGQNAKGNGKGGAGKGGAAVAVQKKVPATPAQKDHTAELKVKIAKLTKEAEGTQKVFEATLKTSKALLENEKASAAALKASCDTMEKQQTKLNEMMKGLSNEVVEVRKLGIKYNTQATEVQQLLTKVRAHWQAATQQVAKLKPKAAKVELEAANKAKEAKDAAACKTLLAKARNEVTAADNAANAVQKKANPLISSPPEDGEEKDKQVAAVEAAATEAIKKLETCRTALSEHTKSIMAYAPEAKKTGQAALVELTKKINDGMKQLNIYKVFKMQLPRLVEQQKAVAEINEKLAGHESALSKATELSKATAMTKNKVQQLEEHLEPILKACKEVVLALTKLRSGDAVTQDKAAKLKTKHDELKAKVDAIHLKVKPQRDAIRAEEGVDTAKEMLEKCEEAWKACGDAEMPFLMGVEMLPGDQNDKALTACKDASTAATAALNAAKSHVKTRLAEARGYEKELAASTTKDLTAVLKEMDAYEPKLSKFRKELAERRVLPLIAEAVEATEQFSKKVKTAESEANALASLEDSSIDQIKETIEKVKTAANEAQTAGSSAKAVAQKKLREAHAGQSHPAVGNMNHDLQTSHDKVAKIRQSIQKAELLLRAKNALITGEEKTKEADEAVSKAKGLVPAGDFTVDAVKATDEAFATALKLIGTATATVRQGTAGATGKAKEELDKLVTRCTEAKTTIDTLKKDSKDRRDAALASHFVEEAETKTKAAEDACAKMEEAEGPFLVGSAMTTSAKTNEVLVKCNEALKATTEAMGALRTYTGAKQNESRQFTKESADKVKDAFAEKTERLKKIQGKVQTFEKDSRERAKEARMLEASEKGAELEESVKKTLEAAEPFTKEGADKMTEAEAEAPLKVFMDANDETHKKIQALASFLAARSKEVKDQKDHQETIKKLNEAIAKHRTDIAEKKKHTAAHEKRALAKRLVAESKELVGGLDAEVKKATDACAKLLEDGGEQFLVGNSMQTLAHILQKHMDAKDLAAEDVFKTIKKGKDAKEADFTKWLAALPETIGHDELSAISDERRVAMFKRIASGSGVSATDFDGLFKQECQCIKPITVTDKFETEGAETLCKVEVNTTVELFGRRKTDAAGLVRSQCKVGDKVGWITLRQEKGGRFVGNAQSPFRAFSQGMDKALVEGLAAIQKVGNSLGVKLKQGAPETEGPLKDAREEMAKLKEQVATALKSMDDLKKKAHVAKQAFHAKENTERNAHIEAKNAKEAAPFLADPKAKLEALEALVKACDEAAAPMIAISNDDLKTFATPASVLEAVEGHAAALKEKADAVREAVKEQTKAVSEVTPQTGGTGLAKKQLSTINAQVEGHTKKVRTNVSVLSNKCKGLTAAKMDPVAKAIRDAAGAKKQTVEAFFDELKSGDKIPEAAFCKMLESLEVDGGKLSSEIAKLVCRKLEADGISKDVFMKYVVLYFKVVRTIAYTDVMDISSCKTIRKSEEGEIVEVLEGPILDEANGMTRIRAKSCKKDDTTVGWITLSGSKGTAFLEKTVKPASA